MKKRSILFLLVFLIYGCTYTNSTSSESSFHKSQPSISVNPYSSITEDFDGYTEIGEMIKKGKGTYKVKGTIVKKVFVDEKLTIWIQRTNKAGEEESLVLKNCSPTYSTILEGILICCEGNYSLSNNLPSMDNPQIRILGNLPQKKDLLQLESWSQLNDTYLNRYVHLQDVSFTSIGNEVSNDGEESISLGHFGSEEIIVNSKCQKKNSNNNVLKMINRAYSQNKKVSINGIIEKNGDKYCLSIVNEFDIVLEGLKTLSQERKVSLYAINDFHGAVNPNPGAPNYEEGIVKVGSFLKGKGQEDNTLILSSGDMWQGSLQSNHNRGNLLTDIMNDAQFDCFTLGNHEFDWGQEYIHKNRLRKGPNGNDINGYQTPFLAANIYEYDLDNNQVGSYASLGDKYVIRELENGLKVGIIGVIGRDQITSITSQYVDDLTFLQPTEIVKELSLQLRIEQGVDVVVLDAHTDVASITESNKDSITDYANLTSIDSKTNKRYVDAVFCAHSHRNENYLLNGVPFIQASSNGKSYGNIELVVNEQGEVTCSSRDYIYTSNIPSYYEDQSIVDLVERYDHSSYPIGQEFLGELKGTLTSSGEKCIANLVTVAMAKYAEKQHIDIDYAVTNGGRADLTGGDITYDKLFKSIPFDNVVYVIETRGSYLYNEIRYNYFYRVDNEAFKTSKMYKVAVIDYLAFHRNANREYNYFNEFTEIAKLTKQGYDIYNYREITADYIRSYNGVLNASDYSNSQDRHNAKMLNYDL